MSAKDYTLSPVNTSGINLPETLEELTESTGKECPRSLGVRENKSRMELRACTG